MELTQQEPAAREFPAVAQILHLAALRVEEDILRLEWRASMIPLIWFSLGALAMLVFLVAAPDIWLAIYVRVFGRMP